MIYRVYLFAMLAFHAGFAKASQPASAPEPLPEPLELGYALSLSKANNIVLSMVENELAASRIKQDLIRADVGLNATFTARARWAESPPALQYLGRKDHAALLAVSKPLYDFGRTSNKLRAGEKNQEIAALRIKRSTQTHRLQIMRAFFDVLLADLMFARDNEAMAMGYIYYDEMKERESLGQKSELDVLEKDSFYQQARQARYESESRQRLSRNYLTQLLDRPGRLPSRLVMPRLEYHKLKIKEVEVLSKVALARNLDLRILAETLTALKYEASAIRAQRLPLLTAEVESGYYQRNIGGNDIWRAGVAVEVPLFQGGKISAELALVKNQIRQLELEIYRKKQDIKHQVLENWLALGDLTIQSRAAEVLYDYREYDLDRARALYEMDAESNLGDSMVALTTASLKIAQARFEIAMRWEILAQLTQMTVAEMRMEKPLEEDQL